MGSGSKRFSLEQLGYVSLCWMKSDSVAGPQSYTKRRSDGAITLMCQSLHDTGAPFRPIGIGGFGLRAL
jgi:hypothetical protein